MKHTLVREWMTPNPVTCPSTMSIGEADELMTARNIRRLLVVDDGHLKGIVTRGDVRGAKPSDATTLSVFEIHTLLSKLTVGKIMNTHVLTVAPNTTIHDAAKLMLDRKIAGLPVVEHGHLMGIITESDIFRMVVKTWEEEA